MGNPLSDMMGGSSGEAGKMTRVPIRATPELRQQDFLTDFFKRFGGGGGQDFGNPNYRSSLEGYFNKPFEEIGGQLSKVNTFLPKNPAPYGYKDVYKPAKGGGGGMFSGMMPGGNKGMFGGMGGGGMSMPLMQGGMGGQGMMPQGNPMDMFGLNLF